MKNPLREALRHSDLYLSWKRLGHYPDFWYWKLRGEPQRSPHVIKQRAVLEYARRYQLHTLVETGTYYGEMVAATRTNFTAIYTIEYDATLAEMAAKAFASYPHIQVIHGDSQVAVPEILKSLTTPTLFWLDAGYYGWEGLVGDRARLTTELESILEHPVPGHVILMDDARGLNGQNGSPPLDVFIERVHSRFPDRQIEVRQDILRITPKA